MAVSSQSSTLGTDDLKSLSLFKFSYVTSPSMQGKLLWTHLPQRDNLFAVFDQIYCKDLSGLLVKRRFLKIIRGGDVLVFSLPFTLLHGAQAMCLLTPL